VVAGLQEFDSVVVYEVNDPMFLGQTARPGAAASVFQGLRHSDAVKWVANDCLYEIQGPERKPPIGSNPVSKVVPKFWMDDNDPLH